MGIILCRTQKPLCPDSKIAGSRSQISIDGGGLEQDDGCQVTHMCREGFASPPMNAYGRWRREYRSRRQRSPAEFRPYSHQQSGKDAFMQACVSTGELKKWGTVTEEVMDDLGTTE